MFAGSPVGLAAGSVYTALLLFAALVDVRSRRIPNLVVLPLLVLGLAYTLTLAAGMSGLVRGLAGVGVGFALWLPFHLLGWIGAGDVKLFAAAGAWLGPARTVEGALIAALAGGVLALAWMIWAYGARRTAQRLSIVAILPSAIGADEDETTRARALPYGVALATGALVAGWLSEPLLFG